MTLRQNKEELTQWLLCGEVWWCIIMYDEVSQMEVWEMKRGRKKQLSELWTLLRHAGVWGGIMKYDEACTRWEGEKNSHICWEAWSLKTSHDREWDTIKYHTVSVGMLRFDEGRWGMTRSRDWGMISQGGDVIHMCRRQLGNTPRQVCHKVGKPWWIS